MAIGIISVKKNIPMPLKCHFQDTWINICIFFFAYVLIYAQFYKKKKSVDLCDYVISLWK